MGDNLRPGREGKVSVVVGGHNPAARARQLCLAMLGQTGRGRRGWTAGWRGSAADAARFRDARRECRVERARAGRRTRAGRGSRFESHGRGTHTVPTRGGTRRRLGILLHGLVVRILAGVVGDDESATNAAGGARRAEARRVAARDAAPRPASGETRLARASAFSLGDSSAARSAHRKRHRLDARVDPTRAYPERRACFRAGREWRRGAPNASHTPRNPRPW